MGREVSAEMKERLGVLPAGLREASANAGWLIEHPEAIRRYPGHWLCIVDEQIVVADTDEHAFQRHAQRFADREGVYILRVPMPDELRAAHPL
jgi:hypothetical protein